MSKKSKTSVAPCHAVAQRRRKQHNPSIHNPQSSILNTSLPWIMWSLAALFFGIRYTLDVFPGIVAHDLVMTLHTNATMLGYLASCYFYAYILTQVPIGILLDRFGPRALTTMAAAIAGVGCILFAIAKTFAIAALARLVTGFGTSFAIVATLYVAATWLPVHRYALATGLTLTLGMLGAAAGQAPVAILVDKLGWRGTLYIFAGICFALTILIWIFMRDRPETDEEKHPRNNHILAGIKGVCKDWQSWMIILYSGFLFMPTVVFGSLWGVPFIQRRLHVHNTTAAFIVSLLFFGWAVGAPFFGWLSGKVKSHKIPMLIAGWSITIALSLIIFLPGIKTFTIEMLLLAFGFFSGGVAIAFPAIRELHPLKHAGAIIGFKNTICTLIGALGQPLVGFMLDLGPHDVAKHGLVAYPLIDFQWALAVLPALMFVGTMLLFWIRETYEFRLEGS